jgi:hypothetical protein
MAAKKRSAAEILARVADKRRASVAPEPKVQALKGLWDREFGVYHAKVVQVTARRGARLSFRFVLDTAGALGKKQHTVSLDDGEMVWADLPSTAQLWKQGSSKRVGYLLLSPRWLAEHAPAAVAPPPAPPPPPLPAARRVGQAVLGPAPESLLAMVVKVPLVNSL